MFCTYLKNLILIELKQCNFLRTQTLFNLNYKSKFRFQNDLINRRLFCTDENDKYDFCF